MVARCGYEKEILRIRGWKGENLGFKQKGQGLNLPSNCGQEDSLPDPPGVTKVGLGSGWLWTMSHRGGVAEDSTRCAGHPVGGGANCQGFVGRHEDVSENRTQERRVGRQGDHSRRRTALSGGKRPKRKERPPAARAVRDEVQKHTARRAGRREL